MILFDELTDVDLLRSIWASLGRLEDLMAGKEFTVNTRHETRLPDVYVQPPDLERVVEALEELRIDPPDLTDLTQTLMGLQPGPTALELARAIADVLPPSLAETTAPSIELYDAIVRALERLDFRMQAPPSQGYIGGSVNLQAGQVVGIANWDEMPAVSSDISDRAGRLLGQVSVTSALPAGTNTIGYTGTVPGQKVGLGRFNLAGSGRMTLTAAGNLRAVIQNPAGSGKTVSVARIIAFATNTGYASVYVNPTTGLPASAAQPITNAVVGGGVAPVAVLKVDTSLTVALGGGTDTGIVLGIPSNSRSVIDLPPLVLTAGTSMGLNVPFTGAADSTLAAFWWED